MLASGLGDVAVKTLQNGFWACIIVPAYCGVTVH